MNDNNINTVKRGRGRPRKESSTKSIQKDKFVLSLVEPTTYDLQDELVRMDSYIYSQYNE